MGKIIEVGSGFKIEVTVKRAFIERYNLQNLYRYTYYLKMGFDLINEIPASSTVYFEFPPSHANYTEDYLEFFLQQVDEFAKKYRLVTSQVDELLFLAYAFTKNPKQTKLDEIARYQESNLIYKLVTTPITAITKANVDEFLYGNTMLDKDDDLLRLIICYANQPYEQFISNNKLDRNKIKQATWNIILKNFTSDVNISVIVDGYTFTISKDIQLIFNVDGRKIAESCHESQNTKMLKQVLKSLIEDVKHRDPDFFDLLIKHQGQPKSYGNKLKQHLNPNVKVNYKPTFKLFIALISSYLDKEKIRLSIGNKVTRDQKKIIYHYLTLTGLLLREGKFEPYEDSNALKKQLLLNKEKQRDNNEYDVHYLNDFC
jgi:hypothetical protein